MSDWKMVKMLNERYYTKDASEPFLAPESIDLFVTHPPYFNLNSEAYGNPEGQLQNTGDREVFVNKIIGVIKHMEMALKPTGTILIGFPTDPNIYKIIEKINQETKLQYGPMFYWDFTGSGHLGGKVVGVENNIFLNLHKGEQYVSPDYKLDSYTLVHHWLIPDELVKKSYVAFVNDSAPKIVYERLIGRHSKPGDVVADLMAGTGMVLSVAKEMGREVVYNDISTEQLKLAKMIIDNEEETQVELKRKEVIELMTKELIDMNLAMATSQSIPNEQIQEYIKHATFEFNRVNAILFDMLVQRGVIR
jgi:DNA modification methylase